MCDQPSVTSVPNSGEDGPEFPSQMTATTIVYDTHCMGLSFCAALPHVTAVHLFLGYLGGRQFHSDEVVETAIHEWWQII